MNEKRKRGRPTKNPDEKLNNKFDFRLDKNQKDKFIDIAKINNMNPGELGRRIILNYINSYIETNKE